MSTSSVISLLDDAVTMIVVPAPPPVTAKKLTFSFHSGKYFHASYQSSLKIQPVIAGLGETPVGAYLAFWAIPEKQRARK